MEETTEYYLKTIIFIQKVGFQCGGTSRVIYRSEYLLCWYQGALAGETKRRVFQIPCEMQRSLDLLRPDYTEERNKRE